MLKGIDISTWNIINDYGKVSDQIDFTIIKATQGRSVSDNGKYNLFTDGKFHNHMKGFIGTKTDIGVYHYLTARTVDEAKREAEYFCSVIMPYKDKINLWAAVDVEEQKYLPLNNKALLTTIVAAFCHVVESNGFKPMIYTNLNFLANHMNNLLQYDLWLALWRDVNNVPSFAVYPNMKLWQYADNGCINGMIGNVDMNIGFYEGEDDKMADNKNIPSDWAKEDWELAKQLKITDGTRPKDTVTREEMVVMILRALGIAKSKI